MNLYHINQKSYLRMKYIRCILIVMLLGVFMEAQATHIVGGNLQYRCLGNDQYEITLYFLRDCINANPEAVVDSPAIVSFYDVNYKPINTVGELGAIGHIKMEYYTMDTLFSLINNPCYTAGGTVCVEKTVYKDTVRLPFRPGGYRLAYQRCCRNILIQNVIVDPLLSGATYELYISEEALNECNSGPQLKDFPELYVCVNNEFRFDQSYTDAEGDSIVYSLCKPNAGASKEHPIPGVHPPAPFPQIEWNPGYSTLDMMGNPADPVTISQDGIITGTPVNIGTYLIGFCIKEYRDGKLLTSTIRDFEVTVLPCEEVPQARIGLPNVICNGTEVDFINNSVNAEYYKWYFDLSDTTLTSTEESPTFTYQDTGCYEIMLVVTSDSICFDTARQTLCVYEDTMEPSFDYESLGACSDSSIVYFYNTSVDTLTGIVEAEWEIRIGNDTIQLSGDTIAYTFTEEGTASVTLTVTSATGCTESYTEDNVEINFFDLELEGDSLSVCRGSSITLIKNGDPNLTYTYEPTTGLDLLNPHNPIASPDSSITYVITVTDGVCSITDSVYVEVKGEDFDIIDLSDDCSTTKILTTSNNSHISIVWSEDPSFGNFIGIEDTLEVEVTGEKTIYVVVQDTSIGCSIKDSITLQYEGIKLDYADSLSLCAGTETEVTIKNLNAQHDVEISWENNPIITSSLDSSTITVLSTEVGENQLIFFAEADNGCTLRDTIIVEFKDSLDVDFAFANECGSLTVEFTNNSDAGNYNWVFGDGETSTEENPTHTYTEPGTYTVSLTIVNGCSSTMTQTISVDTFDVGDIQDQVSSCFGNPVQLNPGGNPDLNYAWSPENGLDDPTSYNPTASISDSTWYYVTITDDDTDCRSIDSILVIPVDSFTVTASPDIQVCSDDPVWIVASSSEGSIVWLDDAGQVVGSTDSLLVTPGDSEYYVATASVETCVVTDTVYVSLIDLDDILTITAIPDTIDFGETSQLEVSGGSGNYTYSWEPSDYLDDPTIPNPVAKPKETTTYCVTVTDGSDCEAVKCVTVVVRSAACEPPYVFMPNAFSPNNDGVNDVLYVRGEPITDITWMIYNRWGEKVFATNNPTEGWDGTDKNGKIVPDDVYGYYFKVTCGDGDTYEEKGNVSLIR